MIGTEDQTPCGALFSVFKRYAHISNLDLCTLILSNRPLPDGRSPASRATDRSWVSRFIVHAPVGSLQQRYFSDYGLAAGRVMAQLKLRKRNTMKSADIINLVCDAGRAPMEKALSACHQDVYLYRNALDRFSHAAELNVNERAETLLVFFMAVGCSADVRASVTYALEYANTACGGGTSTPSSLSFDAGTEQCSRAVAPHRLGLLRVDNGYVVGAPHWVDPSVDEIEVGALATGPNDITDVGPDVSAHHARIWHDAEGTWLVSDLDSTNGTVVASAADVLEASVSGDESCELHPGDQLRLGTSTTYVVLAGAMGD